MKLIISNVSGVPIYEQIKQQIKAAILSGELQAEETLPSLRTLAKDLKISVLTVTKAYTELEQEGFVKNVQGRGCFVMGSGSELIKEQLICKVENNLTEVLHPYHRRFGACSRLYYLHQLWRAVLYWQQR